MGLLTVTLATANADIIYLGFVFSLWVAVTAAYVPGTGVIEVVSLVGFGMVIAVLTQLPTNWFSVMLIAIGGSLFMLVPFIRSQYAPFALVGLALQGLGGAFLFSEQLSVSPLILGISLILPAAYHQLVLMPMLRNARQRPVEDRDTRLIGQVGRVTRTLDPFGTVHVSSESWTASAEDQETVIEKGSRVVVVGRESLRLIVEPLKRKNEDPEPPQEVQMTEGSTP